MIEAMGYRRQQVYIANVVKCRPPGNRNPEPDEIEAWMTTPWEEARALQRPLAEDRLAIVSKPAEPATTQGTLL
jgi:uracil-DNA glycosylase family 4